MEAFNTNQDASARLNGTIVLYKGQPHYATHHRDEVFKVNPLTRGPSDLVPYTSNDFQAIFFELGFVNTATNCCYIEIVPGRNNRQGLNPANLFSRDIKSSTHQFDSVFDWCTSYFSDCLMNKYPTFTEAKEILKSKSKVRSIAFSKEMMLERLSFEDVCLKLCDSVGELGLIFGNTFIPFKNARVSFVIKMLKKQGWFESAGLKIYTGDFQ
jgi:hypothetical protein